MNKDVNEERALTLLLLSFTPHCFYNLSPINNMSVISST